MGRGVLFPSLPAASLTPNQPPVRRGVGWSPVGAPCGGGDGGTDTQGAQGACVHAGATPCSSLTL